MKIKILEGPYTGKVFEFSSPCVTIGRDGGNQMILDTDGVSRCHAELKQIADGSWIISDLNSTNGVKVNGVRIDGSVPVADGTILLIGENLLLVDQLSQEPARVIFNPIISVPPVEASAPSGGTGDAAGAAPAAAPAAAVPEPEADDTEKAGFLRLHPQKDNSKPAVKPARTVVGLDMKNLPGSLFGTKSRSKDSEKVSASANEPEENDLRKKRSNLFFYIIVTCVVIMVLSTVFSIMSPKSKKKGTVRETPIAIRYEKEIFSKENVFRFEFDLKSSLERSGEDKKDENGKVVRAPLARVYKVTFTVDDIASHRHFSRETTLSSESVEELRQTIRSSGIYSISQGEKSGANDPVSRRLTIVDKGKVFTASVAGKYASTEFNTVEEAVIGLTEAFGIKTISMTPKELMEIAEKSFINAEDLYANRRAGATNLRMAIKNYQITVESLEQFSPKPPRWEQARRKLAEAVKEREIALGALETEYKRLGQQRSFEAMKPVFRQIMDLTEPESPQHGSARRRLIYIEQVLRKKKKK